MQELRKELIREAVKELVNKIGDMQMGKQLSDSEWKEVIKQVAKIMGM